MQTHILFALRSVMVMLVAVVLLALWGWFVLWRWLDRGPYAG